MFDLDAFLRNSGFDRYDRNARLYPAFLSLLPLFVVVALWFPPAWTLLGGLLSLVTGLGAIYLLGQVVRYRGRKLEMKLGSRVGRAKTARLLSHSDPDIPAGTKARYHTYLRQHGVHVPAIDHEQADPAAAHGAFLSAVDWLLVHLRPKAKASGLLNENIAYGFRRNLLGVKPAAMAILLIAMAVDAGLLWRGGEPNQAVAGGVIELLMAGCLLGWLLIVRADFVEDASAAYAKRFLEQCEPKRVIRKPAQREVVP